MSINPSGKTGEAREKQALVLAFLSVWAFFGLLRQPQLGLWVCWAGANHQPDDA